MHVQALKAHIGDVNVLAAGDFLVMLSEPLLERSSLPNVDECALVEELVHSLAGRKRIQHFGSSWPTSRFSNAVTSCDESEETISISNRPKQDTR
jgi:hypothetical protein